MNKKAAITIQRRQDKIRETILDHLQKMPIIQLVCEKACIARATFYRWMEQSPDFKKAVEQASQEGHRRIGDLAESKLIQLIGDNNLGAIIFYLRSHNKGYKPAIVTEIKPYDPEDDGMSEKDKEKLSKFMEANHVSCKACEEKQNKEHDKWSKKYGSLEF